MGEVIRGVGGALGVSRGLAQLPEITCSVSKPGEPWVELSNNGAASSCGQTKRWIVSWYYMLQRRSMAWPAYSVQLECSRFLGFRLQAARDSKVAQKTASIA